jgi:glycosyltransferase involved in cell wall biosynthesis
MRITIVLGPFLPVPAVLGGAVEKVHLLLAGAYRDAGHDVTIVSRRYKDFPNEAIVDGIRHIRIASTDRSSSLSVNLALDLAYALRVAHTLPTSDVTVTNSFFLPLVLPRRTAGKIYVQVGRFPKHQMFLYFRASRIQAVSSAIAAAIRDQAPWLGHKVATIGYAIGDAYFTDLSVRTREKVVLFVGRIAREKGIELLLKAFMSLPTDRASDGAADWTLRIVGPHETTQGGDGADYLGYLKKMASPLGHRCEFVGPIFDQDALIREYRKGAIFVYPSLAERGEALPVAPLEAMAAGCAAVVSNLRCFDDYIDPPVTGLRFDHGDVDPEANLAAQLISLIEAPDRLQQIAEAGYGSACKFRTPAIAARMLDDFASLLDDRGEARERGATAQRLTI